MNTSPPGPDESKGPLLIGITTFLYALSLSLYGTRIYSRVRPTLRLGLDDFFVTLAVLFALAEWILLLISITYGVGRHNFYVKPDDLENAEKYLFLSQPPFAWALAFAKLSIIWMLIRIQRDHKLWTIFLYIMMVFVVLTSVTINAFQFSICKPLSAIWDHTIPNPVCMAPEVSQASIYATAAATILTDFVLSAMPITFIVHIQRPWRERIALIGVMGLGIIASAASIAKTTRVKDYGATGDDLMDSVGITIFSILEIQLAIIASCIPTLKQLFESALQRLGLLSTAHGTSRSGYSKHGEGTSHAMSSVRKTKRDAELTSHTDDVESASSFSKPSYFQTGVKAHAEAGSSQEHMVVRDADGIQVGTTVSVRMTSKTSMNDVPL